MGHQIQAIPPHEKKKKRAFGLLGFVGCGPLPHLPQFHISTSSHPLSPSQTRSSNRGIRCDMARKLLEEDYWNPSMRPIAFFLRLQTSSRHKLVIAGVILIIAPLFILVSRHSPSSSLRNEDLDWNRQLPLYELAGNLDYVQDTQLVWQIPPSPKAVLFIAHGCHGSATYFWDKSPNCAECLGLPEERMIVMHALSKGYAVVAISSTRECWSLATDKAKVVVTLSSWIRERGLEMLPLVALGASSGGYFVSALAREYKYTAIVIMISEGIFQTLEVDEHYPSTLFVHMVKDKRRAILIKDATELLKGKGIDTAELKCYPLPVTPHYFTRIPGLDAATSERIHGALKDDILDNENFMMADGRSFNWMVPVSRKKALPEARYKMLDLQMRELLNLAYGFHEMTSMPSDDIFQWLDAHLQTEAA